MGSGTLITRDIQGWSAAGDARTTRSVIQRWTSGCAVSRSILLRAVLASSQLCPCTQFRAPNPAASSHPIPAVSTRPSFSHTLGACTQCPHARSHARQFKKIKDNSIQADNVQRSTSNRRIRPFALPAFCRACRCHDLPCIPPSTPALNTRYSIRNVRLDTPPAPRRYLGTRVQMTSCVMRRAFSIEPKADNP